MKDSSKKDSRGLTTYGRQVLSYFYKRHNKNSEFNSEEDFVNYALEKGYKDTLEITLEDEVLGLTKKNIIIGVNRTHLRPQQLGLYKDRNKLTYGDNVNLLKEIGAVLEDIGNKYNAALYYLELIKADNSTDSVDNARMYLINGQKNLRKIEDILVQLDIRP